ncbi:MAG: hypothetical protein RLZZ450_5122 [Pseudomonadota bacterium]|jgi:hypothetical protein
MSEPCSPRPSWNAQCRRFFARTRKNRALRSRRRELWVCTAWLLVSGCRLEPEGTAPPPETEVDDTAPAAVREGKDASRSEADAAPVVPSGRDPVLERDAGARAPSVDAGRTPSEMRAPQDAGAFDAGRSEPAREPDDAGSSFHDGPDACVVQGSYALETEIDVEWAGSSVGNLALIAGGTGKVVMRSLTELDVNTRQATLSPCQLWMPDFETAPGSVIGKEIYGMDVPVGAWESPSMPHWQTPWGLSCNTPGCTIFSGMLESVVGARVTSMPFAWPAAGGPREGFLVTDDDNDGLPGVTFVTRGPDSKRGEQAYAYPPLVTSLLSRARSVVVAIGLRTQMQGTLESCNHYTGTLSFGGMYARTLGCMKQYGGRREEPCEQADLQFLDDHLPVWRVLGGHFRATRIATPTCAAVRAESIEP